MDSTFPRPLILLPHHSLPRGGEPRCYIKRVFIDTTLTLILPATAPVDFPLSIVGLGTRKLEVVHVDDEAVLIQEDDVRLEGAPQPLPALLRYELPHLGFIQELPLARRIVELEAGVEQVAPG